MVAAHLSVLRGASLVFRPRTDPGSKLHVRWFRHWEPELDRALVRLPENPICPPELYRALATNPSDLPKRIALVSHQGQPVAVIALRHAGGFQWEPITRWILPGFVAPAYDEWLIPAVAALGIEVQVAWWRMGSAPDNERVRSLTVMPVHRIRLEEREEYWRGRRYLRHVTNARRRCSHLTLTINEPGAAEWVLGRWQGKWQGEMKQDSVLDDRIVAANHLQEQGRHFTMVLKDGDRRLAGATNYVDGDTLVASALYREPGLGSLPTGVRLIDASFDLAEDQGLSYYDLGGGHDYKDRWAPEDGERAHFTIAPASLHFSRRALDRFVTTATHRLQRSNGTQPAAAAVEG